MCVVYYGEVVYNKEYGFGFNYLINDISVIYMIERDDVER